MKFSFPQRCVEVWNGLDKRVVEARTINKLKEMLPIPWLLFALGEVIKNLLNGRDPGDINPIEVKSDGMACSIMLLFGMLMFVIVAIACSKWKMNKGLGMTMFVLYFIFVMVSLFFEYDIIFCFI
ncbi:Sodium/potassium/calcium exchanger Nckx30C [Portunus trituberculatus]|uniref:Sodium/potassium/calcium exchanger Nckx30C n=1 Tax=Portunus trituberculatus TaxID=210409 RepID=A0A5B7E464_PORTR|nr:Sodium/potassium/calcium exchanger Nckx30C [Portunus trituberculatus]